MPIYLTSGAAAPRRGPGVNAPLTRRWVSSSACQIELKRCATGLRCAGAICVSGAVGISRSNYMRQIADDLDAINKPEITRQLPDTPGRGAVGGRGARGPWTALPLGSAGAWKNGR